MDDYIELSFDHKREDDSYDDKTSEQEEEDDDDDLIVDIDEDIEQGYIDDGFFDLEQARLSSERNRKTTAIQDSNSESSKNIRSDNAINNSNGNTLNSLSVEGSKMAETFSQYLDKWLKHSTVQGLNNPLVKMPVKRFRPLSSTEYESISRGGSMIIGTSSDPIARNLFKNFQTRIRERGEHSAFLAFGALEMTIAAGIGQQPRNALFPVILKKAILQSNNERIKAIISEDDEWQINPVLDTHLLSQNIKISSIASTSPDYIIRWLSAQLGNRGKATYDSYIGLFSSQQMVVQQRLSELPLRQALARNPVIQAKINGAKIEGTHLGEITDDGLEEMGLVLPSDDSQLRVIQLSDRGICLQVEGPPGTGKSQTIANTISNAIYHGRKVLFVCDKKAAITQVEERLSKCGLNPAILNLHDEDLDKREFLRQATSKFPANTTNSYSNNYPIEQLRETRKILNSRVIFGRKISHPSLQISNRQAIAGMIDLKKRLVDIPKLEIPNWQALSKDRLDKLLRSIAEWPGLATVIANTKSIWNRICPEAFYENANASNELSEFVKNLFRTLESIELHRENAASLGIELPIASDKDVSNIIDLCRIVIEKPGCTNKIIGNPDLTEEELSYLHTAWCRRDALKSIGHPLNLEASVAGDEIAQARELLTREKADTWSELSARHGFCTEQSNRIQEHQVSYKKLCNQLGLVYSPLLRVRRAQFQSILSLGTYGGLIPRSWWNSSSNPVLIVNGWLSQIRACSEILKISPLPVHFIALERISSKYWEHVEALAEHGFNFISYCTKYVSDRKCKYALRQAYPSIPVKNFKGWRDVTLHAVNANTTVKALRLSAHDHVILTQLTENYLSMGHEIGSDISTFTKSDDIAKLQAAAVHVEQCRSRNDLFEISNIHWQSFWESPNPQMIAVVEKTLNDLDAIVLQNSEDDNLEVALEQYSQRINSIDSFLLRHETENGNKQLSVLEGFTAQKEHHNLNTVLESVKKYTELQDSNNTPNWVFLKMTLAWRTTFEQLRGNQKLNIDSSIWHKLHLGLEEYISTTQAVYSSLALYFSGFQELFDDFDSLVSVLNEIQLEIDRYPLWLEKKKWELKLPAYPELKTLWPKVTNGDIEPANAEPLFCFNLLRNCDPISKPQGPELMQTINSFVEQDTNLGNWILEHLKARLSKAMNDASLTSAQGYTELRRLAGLQRIRGTVRELLNAHLSYLFAAKPCWMMSPTSLANLISSNVFAEYSTPFDLVIFDEASQIRVLDGLLSMAFAKQTIIVGDKNQLPPTDFFASFGNPDSDVDGQDFGISESLLDEFAGVFVEDRSHVMLMSHYRSETPDLIRFSNDWFYNSRLEMYPPSRVAGIGRRFHYVKDAIYSEIAGHRNNPTEAREVVKLIELHVTECPDKSLGVVTMNIPQMELIDELIQGASSKVSAFCSNEERFFIRNLETVQGDEMDRIILSLTYGKNKQGQFNASILGPLTKSGGERRLNVAITRSRNGLTVVSSLKSSDLDKSSAQSRGFQCLKAFLLDLESNLTAGNYGVGNKRFGRIKDGISNVVYCESPFEEQVVEFLENEGYEIECQYGAGKFRLDIVVKENGRNLIAIECDGAAYHSSLAARTRDRARQRILENLGWQFHRVWSTNWWFFEQQEKDGIISAINSARNARSK
jgi:very-short-patch-repair endonuclease